jgi:twitching motility two-component system response regulator PilH
MERVGLRRFFRKRKPKTPERVERRRSRRIVPPSGTNVLVVDDSSTIRFVVSKMLWESGYQVVEATNGREGIDMAVEHNPDLILMDVVMPGVNGFQATRMLRKKNETQNIPIIIISGNKQAVEQFWAGKIGASDYMEKPFERGEFFQRMERVLYPYKSSLMADS